jgi:hypothetical protein
MRPWRPVVATTRSASHDGRDVDDLDALFPGPVVAQWVGIRREDAACPAIDHEHRDAEAGRAEPDLADDGAAEVESSPPRGHERGGQGHDRRSMHVVVHDGLREQFDQPALDLEALWRRDVLEVDAAEGRRDLTTGSTNLR